MPPGIRLRRLRHRTGDRTGRHDQALDIEIGRPAHEHEHDEHRRHRHCRGRRFGAPGDRDRRDREHGEGYKRKRIVPAREHQQGRGKQVGASAADDTPIDAAGLRIRTEPQSGDDQRCGERKADDDVEHMRAERVDAAVADAGQGPQHAEGDRGDREPAPQPQARERERGGGHHREIDVERPVIRRCEATSSGVT